MASPDDVAQVQRVYAGALQRDPEERSGYLDRACAGKPWIREQVEALLAANPDGLPPAPLPAAPPPSSGAERAGGAPDRRIGPYVIVGELGRGGMGVVYLADDPRLARRVALKALAPEVANEPGSRARLKLEARAAAALAHPGIATVYALEEFDNELYLACEYVPGESLRSLIQSGPLPLAEVVQIGAQVARTLEVAHANSVVHRDIKPENVVKTPSGVIKVLDFGMARADFAVDAKLTQTGMILGTPAYMAPEQALGERGDFRTDIYGLGLLLFELSTGYNPFAASSALATLARVVKVEPPPPSAVGHHHWPDFDRIVANCLHKDPRQRYRSTAALVADLERLDVELNGPPATPSWRSSGTFAQAPPPPPSIRQRWWERHQVIAATVCVLMLYPAWRAREWVTPPWGMVLLGAALVAAAASTSLRLNLVFLARFADEELARQRPASERWIRTCDLLFAAAALVTGVLVGSAHPATAMLFVAVAVALAISTLVIEPATARAAFGSGKPAS